MTKFLRIESVSRTNLEAAAKTAGDQGWRVVPDGKGGGGIRREASGTAEHAVSYDGDSGDLSGTSGRDPGVAAIWSLLMSASGSGTLEIRSV